jgi:hypothetical protein
VEGERYREENCGDSRRKRDKGEGEGNREKGGNRAGGWEKERWRGGERKRDWDVEGEGKERRIAGTVGERDTKGKERTIEENRDGSREKER